MEQQQNNIGNYQAELSDPELFDFLMNAPKKFKENESIKKFQMRNGDFIHCVMWNYHFYISGTDIVKILIYRFQLEGRQINNLKKYEEGIFSDLRNLKPGIDATLEGPRSDFLEFLYKNGCIRTQKKQKVFYWYSVPHDALFCDAMEREIRRESFFVTAKPFNTGIFNNTKTNRNIVKQRSIKSGTEGYTRNKPAPLFSGIGDEIFSGVNSCKTTKNNDHLIKTLFSNDDSMTNIIKSRKTDKKPSILDEIINYNRKTEYTSEDETDGRNRLFSDLNIKSDTSELDMLIKSADIKLKDNFSSSNKNTNIPNTYSLNDILYKPDAFINNNSTYLNDIGVELFGGEQCAKKKKVENSIHEGGKVELVNKKLNKE